MAEMWADCHADQGTRRSGPSFTPFAEDVDRNRRANTLPHRMNRLTNARAKRWGVVIGDLSIVTGLAPSLSVEDRRVPVIKLSGWFRRGRFPALK